MIFLFEDFDMEYVWNCFCFYGFKVIDYLNGENVLFLRRFKGKLILDMLYCIIVKINDCFFIYFVSFIFKQIEKNEIIIKEVDDMFFGYLNIC